MMAARSQAVEGDEEANVNEPESEADRRANVQGGVYNEQTEAREPADQADVRNSANKLEVQKMIP